jgi:hypothetical protein
MAKPLDPRLQAQLDDVLDPEKVQVYCKDHMYFGPSPNNKKLKPHLGCQKCWFVYYLHDLATTPPDKRYERLQELSQVVHHVVEAVETGTFDFTPFERPTFEITQE